MIVSNRMIMNSGVFRVFIFDLTMNEEYYDPWKNVVVFIRTIIALPGVIADISFRS